MKLLKKWKKATDCVSDVMSASVVTVGDESFVVAAALKMRDHNIGAVPVVSADGKLTGIFTDRDIALRVVAAGFNPDTTMIKSVMTSDVTWCHADLPLDSAVKLMEDASVRRIVVVDLMRKPLSIVSTDDLALRANDLIGHVLAKIAQNAQIAEGLRA